MNFRLGSFVLKFETVVSGKDQHKFGLLDTFIKANPKLIEVESSGILQESKRVQRNGIDIQNWGLTKSKFDNHAIHLTKSNLQFFKLL